MREKNKSYSSSRDKNKSYSSSRDKNKSYSSSRDKNADKESEQVKTAQKEKESKKSFSYNNDNCAQTEKRSRGRPPLREQKNENSVINDFSLSFILDSMLLM